MLFVWISAFVAALLVTSAYHTLASPRQASGGSSFLNRLGGRSAVEGSQPDTLVVYVFSATDPEYIRNLQHFARHGIREGDGCEYVIIVQTTDGEPKPPEGVTLPAVPSNVRYEFHPNGCYDWGTIGWALSNGKVDWRKYKYFIFMNSSVRGPFIPVHMKGLASWQQLLLSRINDDVKLVGPTISCEGSPFQGDVSAEWRTNPHVQSYVLATDQVGLRAWLEEGTVFKCYSSMWDTIYYSELGSSLALLNRGYNIESLMLRYHGVDWRDTANWECNARVNPYAQHYYDGLSVSPMEVMFVKVKGFLLNNNWDYVKTAQKYGQWHDEQATPGPRDVVTNEWKTRTWQIKYPQVLYMRQRGSSCFDLQYYVDHSADLASLAGKPEDAWHHFVEMGQFEGRPFRFTCEPQP